MSLFSVNYYKFLILVLAMINIKMCTAEEAAGPIKICKGTDFKSLDHIPFSEDRNHGMYVLNYYNRIFKECTHVVGNLQLVWFKSKTTKFGDEDLKFLQDIQVVTGYIVLHNVAVETVRFPSLRLILGESLLRLNPDDPEYALVVSGRDSEGDPREIVNLEFPALQEISNGSVIVDSKWPLCHLKSIDWRKILRGTGAHFTFTENRTDGECHGKILCDESCESGRCWSKSPKDCQQLGKFNCSSKCKGRRCFGKGSEQCCHSSCVGGCTGSSSSDCVSCRHLNVSGECKDKCPSPLYRLGPSCKDSCPNLFLTDEETKICLSQCPRDKYEKDGKCVKVSYLQKKCRSPSDFWPYVHSENIHYFKNCTILEGDLYIAGIAFQTSKFFKYNFVTIYNQTRLIQPIHLEVFTSLKQITGQLVVGNAFHAALTNLSYFRNVEVIGEKRQHRGTYHNSIVIQRTSLENVYFKSLKTTHRGGVWITGNLNLCYVSELNWRNIVDDGYIYVYANKLEEDCKREGNYCSDECTWFGCWGPSPSDCAEICPVDMFPSRGRCYPCNSVCANGCTGPSTNIETSGCRFCRQKAVFYGNGTIACIEKTERCPGNYAVGKVNATDEEQAAFVQEGALACKPCHLKCKGCASLDPVTRDCKDCYYYKADSKCVKECPSDYKPNKRIWECTPSFPEGMLSPSPFLVTTLIGGCAVFLLLLVSVSTWCYCRRRIRLSKNMKLVNLPKVGPIPQPSLNITGVQPSLSKFRTINEEDIRIGEIIGIGNFGKVYAGMWTPEKTYMLPVAVKMFYAPPDQKEIKEIVNEAFIMARIAHPHILELLALCMSSQKIMLITPLIPLGCLKNYLQENRNNIGSHLMLTWSTQIAQGMEYLEDKQLIHRDLAARNILLESPLHAKITDFGLAKFLDINKTEFKVQMEMLPIRWLAIESLQSMTFSHKSDVWAFGVTVWEILTYGQDPFQNVPIENLSGALLKGQRLEQPPVCTVDLYNALITTWLPISEARPSFTELKNQFSEMLKDPGRYIVVQGDELMRLPESAPESERDIIRKLSTASSEIDSAVEIVSVKEYFKRIGKYYYCVSERE